ncbi:MAG: hypothetical protein HRU11_01420 [Parvularculaceae bacterium]|nr:hypothetical protein [Parvularculaceae bacterium]
MRWSKLKQRIEERFTPKLKTRVRVDLTKYRWTRNEDGEIRVMVDGERVYCASYWAYAKELHQRREALRLAGEASSTARELSEEALTEEGVSPDYLLARELKWSLDRSIADLLTSEYPLIRGLARIDARTGMRRLETLAYAGEHDFVQRMHDLRI